MFSTVMYRIAPIVVLIFVVSLAATGSAAVFGNSCENGGNPCSSNGVCVGLFAEPFCLCQSGYGGDICNTTTSNNTCPGCTIPDMGNACDAFPCRNNATCVNWFGGFKCLCEENSQGQFCESAELCFLCESLQFTYDTCPIDQTNKLIGNQLRVKDRHSKAWCIPDTRYGLNETDKYIYVDDGCRATFCINFTVDYCAQTPCDLAMYRCENDLEGATHRCIPLNPCSSSPCENNATCVSEGETEFSCNCTEFFTGDICDVEINPCDSNPCQNGANCTRPTPLTISCDCNFNSTGDFCEIAIGIGLSFDNFMEDNPLVEVVFLDSELEGSYFVVNATLTGGDGTSYIYPASPAWIGATIEIFVYHDNDDNQNYNNVDHGYRQVIVLDASFQWVNISYSDLQLLVVCPIGVDGASGFAEGSTGISSFDHFFCYAFSGYSNFTLTGNSSLPLGVVYTGLALTQSSVVSTTSPASSISKYLIPGLYSYVCAYLDAPEYEDPLTTVKDESKLHKFNVPAFYTGNTTNPANGIAENCSPTNYVIQNGNGPFPSGEILPRFVIKDPIDL
ncbi:unnamed protein product [Owenia fusiformis]|uniref:Uncharacterized protein n=1 Tax=Owenia fusiformis TaxID=6347 RepID=A0A8J1UBR7_OWEFU|nr:unnamed protein product [Owenia fusiformis]